VSEQASKVREALVVEGDSTVTRMDVSLDKSLGRRWRRLLVSFLWVGHLLAGCFGRIKLSGAFRSSEVSIAKVTTINT
jgi:hypothetical protein